MTKDEQRVLRPGKAQWLKKASQRRLDEEQKALLLAFTQLESSLGNELTPEESDALESLAEGAEGFDVQALRRAVDEMVNAPSDPDRQVSWQELKRGE